MKRLEPEKPRQRFLHNQKVRNKESINHNSGARGLIGLIGAGTITAADFDGDSRDDIAIFRPSTGLWRRRRAAAL